MKVYNSLLETIGNTPLIRLNKIEKMFDLNVKLLVKVEMFNPSSSVKVRPAYNMIKKAIEDNIISKDTPIIEATSGNIGIALAFVCSVLNMKFVAVMPANMSEERIKLIRAYGAKIVLTEPKLGMNGAVNKAIEIQKELNGFIPSQFKNLNNPLIHYLNTAKEILDDTDNAVDILFAGIGTGGTISGIGKKLKEVKDVKIVGVEPLSSPLLTKGFTSSHKIQGIGANFVPDTLDLSVVDEVVPVSDENAYKMARCLAKDEGILVGISSGAALQGCIEYVLKNKVKDKMIVVIFPDSGERYLSTDLYDE